MKDHYPMPNSGGGDKGGNSKPAGASNTGKSTGLRKQDSQRADVLKTPSTKNPYPNGMC